MVQRSAFATVFSEFVKKFFEKVYPWGYRYQKPCGVFITFKIEMSLAGGGVFLIDIDGLDGVVVGWVLV